jgi:hypothetical protein
MNAGCEAVMHWVGENKGKRTFGKTRRRWEGDI